jgi:hypothetical protein
MIQLPVVLIKSLIHPDGCLNDTFRVLSTLGHHMLLRDKGAVLFIIQDVSENIFLLLMLLQFKRLVLRISSCILLLSLLFEDVLEPEIDNLANFIMIESLKLIQ